MTRDKFREWANKTISRDAARHLSASVSVSDAGLKDITRRLATLSYDGKVDICPHCKGKGEYRGVDASGNNDWCDCRECDGWGIVFGGAAA